MCVISSQIYKIFNILLSVLKRMRIIGHYNEKSNLLIWCTFLLNSYIHITHNVPRVCRRCALPVKLLQSCLTELNYNFALTYQREGHNAL